MAAEKRLIDAIHRKLPRELHKQSMTGVMASNGTLDRYYDGIRRDLWIEWKAQEHMPRSGIVSTLPVPGRKYTSGHLTPLQYQWFCRRDRNGGNAAVLCGLPGDKVVIFNCRRDVDAGLPIEQASTYAEAVEWITTFCMGSPPKK